MEDEDVRWEGKALFWLWVLQAVCKSVLWGLGFYIAFHLIHKYW
jgi:hypothetical protein